GLALIEVALLDQNLVGNVLARHPSRAGRGDVQSKLARQLPEIDALGDEVRLAVDLHQHPDLRRVVVAGFVQVRLDHALAGGATGALRGFGYSLRAQYRLGPHE